MKKNRKQISKRITIYTWGKARRRYKPDISEKNYSVAYLFKVKPKGVNLKKVTGRSRVIQDHIKQQKNYNSTVTKIVNDVLENGYLNISISCEHGKHRSVAIAEFVKKELQTKGKLVNVVHLHS